jgi:hypothetical protein
MRRILALLMLLVLLFSFQPAHAQEQPSLSSVEVWIWPEYDRPEVLVIEHILVSPDTTFPVTMTFRIPAAAEKPAAMAVGQTPQTVGDTPYTLKPDGKWIAVSVQVNGPAIQLEYYDPSLSKNGKNREYSYEWISDYTVQNFHVELQQPFDASGVQTVPALPDEKTIPDGLTYRTGDFGALEAGKSFTLATKYQKDSDALSISFINIPALADRGIWRTDDRGRTILLFPRDGAPASISQAPSYRQRGDRRRADALSAVRHARPKWRPVLPHLRHAPAPERLKVDRIE